MNKNKYSFLPNQVLVEYFNKHNQKKQFKLYQIGCNSGRNIVSLYNEYPKAEYYGIDILPDAITEARKYAPYANFYIGNAEESSLFYNEQCFDYILLLDVLEHFSQPQKVLNYVKTILKPDGMIIANIPNLMHWSIMYNLLIKGNFTYTNIGLLDYDHKHLFTYNEVLKLFQNTGFYINEMMLVKIDNIPEDYMEFFKSLANASNGNVNLTQYETWTFTLTAQHNT